jgi:radical SAM superfamily enzyme YgiQ (UPF0313 family)
MHNIYLFQPQFSVEFHGQKNYWIPYSVGCLWSYLQQYKDITDNWNLKELGHKREDQQLIIDRMENPKLCGFSCYVWNERYSLDLAKKVKEKFPDCVIAFGGPQVNSSFLEHDFIDTVVYGEGERSFHSMMNLIHNNEPVKQVWEKDRLSDLNYPSPYTTGVFDQLVIDNPDATWQVTLETNRGCPYACTFCDWGSATYTKVRRFDVERVREEIDWIATHNCSYIFCADANFGIFRDRDIEIAHMLRGALEHPESKLESINIQFAKNSNETVFEVGKILGDALKGITFSVQSMNPDTLEVIKRKNMKVNKFSELMELGQKYETSTYTDMILGMPLETLETWKDGLNELLEVGQHQAIDIWFTQLLPNSELSQPESREKYGITHVSAENYTNMYNIEDQHAEIMDLINGTNTMSTEEMVKAYAYGWLITQFHIPGYSQLLAKYARNVMNVPYRVFYDELWERVKNDDIFSPILNDLNDTVYHYLKTGKIISDDPSKKGHSLLHYNSKFIYDNKDRIIELAMKFFDYLPDDIIEMQKYYVVSPGQPEQINILSSLNIEDWSHTATNYSIETKIPYDDNFDFWHNRRRGLIKNKITEAK